MIGKVPDQGRSFRGVVNYLLYGKKGEPKPERVAWAETRNLLVDDPKKAATLMRLTAQKSRRVKTPVYHYVVSWRHDERPTDGVMREVADTTCADLGLDEYQKLYVGHRDTEHSHVHVVVNRVHPETGKAWRNSHDYRRIECSLRRQAEAMGMEYVPGRHNDPEQFYGQSRKPKQREQQQGRRLGQKPRARWDKARIAEERGKLQDAFAEAQSWVELEARLAERGKTLERKGQGLTIGDDSGAMKLSDLRRNIRLKELEERFKGSFAEHERSRPAPAPERIQDEAREAYADTAAGAEMSYYLYRMGIASRDELDRNMKAKEAAREALEEDRPLLERLGRNVMKDEKVEPPEPSPTKEPFPSAGHNAGHRRSRGRGR